MLMNRFNIPYLPAYRQAGGTVTSHRLLLLTFHFLPFVNLAGWTWHLWVLAESLGHCKLYS